MTSWLGMSCTRMRRSTLTACWMIGMTRIRPGPLTFQNRPSWKMTARSYSRRMRSAENSTRTMKIAGMIHSVLRPISISCSLGARLDLKRESVDPDHADLLARLQRRRPACVPGFAVDAHPALAALPVDHARPAADHLLLPGGHGPAAAAGERCHEQQQHRCGGKRDPADHLPPDAIARRLDVDQ